MSGFRGAGSHLHPLHFGSGLDGAQVFTAGSYGGLVSSFGNYAWTTVSFPAAGSVRLDGVPVYAQGIMTFGAGGTVHCNGFSGVLGVGGLGTGSSMLAGGGAGATGVEDDDGDAGGDVAPVYVGLGKNGGAGGAATAAGGVGGLGVTSDIFFGTQSRVITDFYSMYSRFARGGYTNGVDFFSRPIGGGGGGGSGGSAGAGAISGGGGSGGGIIWICADTIVFGQNVILSVAGGAGAAGSGVGDAGGGGGGSGGGIILIYNDMILPGSNKPTLTLSGGAGGLGFGSGNSGVGGQVGNAVLFNMSTGTVQHFTSSGTITSTG